MTRDRYLDGLVHLSAKPPTRSVSQPRFRVKHRKRRQNEKKGEGEGETERGAEESEWGYPSGGHGRCPKGERHTGERDRRATFSYLMDN